MDDLYSRFTDKKPWGLSCSIDAKNANPKLIRSKSHIKKYVRALLELIDMRPYGACKVIHFGQDVRVAGYSMTQLIETSLISGHFANQFNKLYIDIFSCKFYEPETVCQFTVECFQAELVSCTSLLRA